MRTSALTTLTVLSVLAGVVAPCAAAGTVTKIGNYSTQGSSSKATVGSHITVSTGGSSKTTAGGGSSSSSGGGSSSGSSNGTTTPVVVLPTLPSNSPLLKNPTPDGPGTFWYQGASGEECIYVPDASPVCYVIVAPTVTAADVAAMIDQASDELTLTLAGIEASPPATADGLTGATSWFWLASAPAVQRQSVGLDRETVTVTAEPSQITWNFGDGATLTGGSGVAYRAGAVPADAITHVYQTRCLPGDQGSDPYVLPSCQPNGYEVTATVTWAITYTATGPISESGSLAARTTESELAYPVSEVRGFLTGGPT